MGGTVAIGHRFFLNNGKVVGTDFLVAAENVGTLDQVLQFAEIAWEPILLQFSQSVGIQPPSRHLQFGRDLVTEYVAQSCDILAPVAQRRKMDWHDSQPV